VGAEYTFDVSIEEMGGQLMPTTLKVIETEPPSRIVFETGPWYAREICTFEPRAGGGTHLVFAYATYVPDELDNEEGRALIERSGRRQARLELDHIKRNLEAGE
jgi:hypothetical protein